MPEIARTILRHSYHSPHPELSSSILALKCAIQLRDLQETEHAFQLLSARRHNDEKITRVS